MKHILYLVTALLLASTNAFAQPQYSHEQTPASFNTIPFSSNTNLRQWIYYPSNFPGMRPGNITKVYLKANGLSTPSFALLTIKMGTTSLSTFSSGPYATGLTTVYQGAYTSTTLPGDWLEITLQTPFYYDSVQNFILECSQVGRNPGFSVMQTNSSVPGRSLAGSITSTSATMQGVLAHVGFDQQVQGTPLDVKLKDFKAQSRDGQSFLNWTVTEEKDMDRYEVERSNDGISFENIGFVYANGEGTGENRYSYIDYSIPSFTASGKLFYRIRMLDLAGDATLSSTAVLNMDKQAKSFSITAAPIPFSQNLTLSVNLTERQICTITVIDITGKIALHKVEDLGPGVSNLSLRELDQLIPGTYFLTASVFGDRQNIRILKQ